MGRQQFSQPINVVSASSKSVVYLAAESAVSLAVAATERIYITAPSKTIARMLALSLSFPPNGAPASGDKTVTIDLDKGGNRLLIAQLKGAFGADITVNASEAQNASLFTVPSDKAGFVTALQGITFTDTAQLGISFLNNTNVAHAANRFLRVLVEAEAVN